MVIRVADQGFISVVAPAAEAGLRASDVIQSINNPVNKTEEVQRLVERSTRG